VLETIASRLSTGEILIEYAQFETGWPRQQPPNLREQEDGHYCAFALTQSSIRLLDTGKASEIDKQVRDFRAAVLERQESVLDLGKQLRHVLPDPILSARMVSRDG
jgi:hypothetical protein